MNPIYRTYAELRGAFLEGKVEDGEYRRYFARMTGAKFDGYPDFSQQYFEEYLGIERKTTKGRKRSHFVVVKSLCNSYGEVIAVRSAYVFLRNSDAMAFLNGLDGDEPVVSLSSKERVVRIGSDYFSYKVVPEERK